MSLEAFVAYLSLERNYSSHTVVAYQKDIQEFSAFASTEYNFNSIDELSYTIIRSWIVSLVDNQISNRTINRKIASLKAYYKFLQKTGIVSKNPLAKHKALRTAKKVEVAFSEKEMDEILNVIEIS